MSFPRKLYGFALLTLICIGSASAQTLLRVKATSNDSSYANHVQTQAHFVYQKKVMGTVNGAKAVLFDTTDPGRVSEAQLILTSRNGVQQAKRICSSYIPGKTLTVGPGGELYFDDVLRGNYQILVCAQVKFGRSTKSTWVAGTLPINNEDFTSRRQDLTLAHPLQIVLDPYAKELKAKPTKLPSLVATR
jgi:hypothetical protein